MKRFLIKFLVFFGLFHATTAFYQFYVVRNSSGDIGKLGQIPFGKKYDGLGIPSFMRSGVDNANAVDVCQPDSLRQYNVITVGDSFSVQYENGYQWKLSSLLGDAIANFPLGKSNPFQCAIKLINSGFIDSSQILIVQSVERNTVLRLTELDTAAIWISKPPVAPNAAAKKDAGPPFLDRYLSWIRLSFDYDDPIPSFILKRECFDNPRYSNELYIYNGECEGDLLFQNYCEDDYAFAASQVRQFISFVKSRGIQVTVLIATDKYDAYEPFIAEEHLVNPTLNYFEGIDELYDPKKDLQKAIENGTLDVYKHNNTHWSVIGADIVAEKLAGYINQGVVKDVK